MNLKEIKELISVMRKNEIAKIDLEQDGTKLCIVATEPPEVKEAAPAAPQMPMPYFMPSAPQPMAAPPAEAAPAPTAPVPAAAAAAPEAAVDPALANAKEITSPMVGTFYRSSTPDAAPYVETGAVVNEDSVLCIVEAMKLMNEIKAEMRGKILKILVENEQPVEFGQPLFLVEPF